ncbi:MAG: peptidoglycan-binding protein [Ferruginibacter sp.]
MKSIKKDSTGNIVSFLKLNLGTLGYNVSNNDVFDENTEASVKDFQGRHGLAVDGVVGPITWVQIYLNTVTPRRTNSRIERSNDIMLLHPVVRKAVVATYVQLVSEGIPFKIFEAYRFPQRQEDLYAQGRTKPGSIVTYAEPWSSYHQYGLAADFVLFINDNWSWDDSTTVRKQWWEKLHSIGQREGLMRLGFETPHLQLAGTSSNALKHGLYPENGDETWAENFNAAIIGWNGQSPAPPRVQHNSTRPNL